MTKLAANLTMLFNEVPFLDRFELASKAGFSGVEYLFPYDYSVDDIGERLDKYNLKQVLFDFPVGDFQGGERGIAIQPERQQEFQDGVGQAIEFAEALNCKRLTVLAGIANEKTSSTSDEMEQLLIENLRYAADAVSGHEITVLLEALNTLDTPNFFVSTTQQSRSIIKSADRENIKLQYDVYHMQIMEGDLARTIETNLDLIAHFQIADNPGRHEPGTGEINYTFLLPQIDKIGYKGWVGCEYIPANETIEGLSWANEFIKSND